MGGEDTGAQWQRFRRALGSHRGSGKTVGQGRAQ